MKNFDPRPDVIATLILCDDIRMEVGNKPSYMGIYTGDIVFEELPAVMLKLCATSSISISKDLPIENLSNWILVDGKEVALTNLRLDQMPNNTFQNDEFTRNVVSLNIVLSPFEVKKEGVLEVGFTLNEKHYLAGKAHFRIAEAKGQTSTESANPIK